MNNDNHSAMTLSVCKGLAQKKCPCLSLPMDSPAGVIARVVQETGWPEFLLKNKPNGIKAHDRLRISVSGCANGCTRPHIADIGLILSAKPAPGPEECMQCGLCVEACPDKALQCTEGGMEIDPERCLACGRCVRSCPAGGLHINEHGYRVLLGGKLGRRPRFARELPGFRGQQEVLGIVSNVLSQAINLHQPDKRISDAIYACTSRDFSSP